MWSHDASATALRQCTNILNPYLYGHSTPQIYHVDFSVASEFLSAASVIDALPTTNFIESHLLSTPLTEIWTYNFGAEISQQDEDRMRMMKKDLGVTIGHVVEKQNMGRREWYTRKDIMDCLVVMVREGGKWDKIDDRWGLDFVDKTISCVEFASF
ncbi:hypothetical protein BDZ45DRAFT_674355 [Acephala macrosclerotiorum]|nr:hypothetical protein BDZ45DRAFT_674355 [Acephala macrosclerotiorum]